MRKNAHCVLCENHQKDFNKGVICGLTKEKGSFASKCSKISFGDSLCKKLESAYFENKLISMDRASVILQLVVVMLISFSFLIGGYLFGKFISNMGVISTVPLIIMGIGFIVFPIGLRPFVKYSQEASGKKSKLTEIEKVMAVYGLEYNIDMNINRGNHNILDIITTISILKNGKQMGNYKNSFVYNDNRNDNKPSGIGIDRQFSSLDTYM